VGNFKKCAAVLAFLFLPVGVCSVASAQEVAPGQTEAVGFIGVTDGGGFTWAEGSTTRSIHDGCSTVNSRT